MSAAVPSGAWEPAHGIAGLLASSRVGQLPPWLPDAYSSPGDVPRVLPQPVGRTAPK